ncbi:MAG: hypothetical protein U0Y08_03175 [Bacteroidia bacterium]
MKTIIRFCLLVITLLGTATFTQAQGPGNRGEERREDIEAMKIAFLTRRLNLTPEEAKKFWPVYNQFSDELKNIRENRNKAAKDFKDNLETLSDKEVEKMVDGEIAFRQQELDILKKYNNQFKQALPMKKVAQLYRAEEDFKRELLERIKERREQRMGPGKGR